MRESNFHFSTQNKACVCITSALYDRRAIDSTSPLALLSTLTHLSYLTSTSPRIRDILCADGGIERLISILINIGKRRRAQRELAKNELKLALSGSCGGSCSVTLAGSASLVRSPFKPFGVVKRQIAAEASASGQSDALPLAAHQAVAVGLTKEQKHTLWTWSLAFQCVVNVGVRGSENVRTRVVEAGVVPIIIGVLGGFLSDLDRKRTMAEKAEREKRRRSEKALTTASRSNQRHSPLAVQAAQFSSHPITTPAAEATQYGPLTGSALSRPDLSNLNHLPAAADVPQPRSHIQHQSQPYWTTPEAVASRNNASRLVISSLSCRSGSVDQTPEGSEEGSVTGEDEDEAVDGDAVMELESSTELGKPLTARRERRGTIKAGPCVRSDASSSNLPGPTMLRLQSFPEPLNGTGSSSTLSSVDVDGDVNMQDLPDGPARTPRALSSRLLSNDEVTNGPPSALTMTSDASMRSGGHSMGERGSLQIRAPSLRSAAPGTSEDQARLPDSVNGIATASPGRLGMNNSPLPSLVTNSTIVPPQAADEGSPPPSPASQLCFRDEDVLLALQLLAYLSKYPHVRAKFHEPADKITLELAYGSTAEAARAVASFAGKVKADRGDRERAKDQPRLAKQGQMPVYVTRDKDRRRVHDSSASTFSTSSAASKPSSTPTSSTASVVSINPLSTNVFSFVEQFTHRSSPHDKHSLPIPEPIQYWAGVIMRNACRKDENRGGIRQCANMQCGVWEQFPREFAKCRRCRKAKYCSKICQSKAWQQGHRYWCSVKDADPVAEGVVVGAHNESHPIAQGTLSPSIAGEGTVVPTRSPGRRRQRDVTASDDDDGEFVATNISTLRNRPFASPISRTGGGTTVGADQPAPEDTILIDGRDALRTLGEMNAELVHAAAAAVAAEELGGGTGLLPDEADVARRMLLSMDDRDDEIVVGRGPGGLMQLR